MEGGEPRRGAMEAYPVSDCHVTTVSPASSSATARLIDAVQRADISREDIARAVVSCNPALQELASTWLNPNLPRTSVHKFCHSVRALDPTALERATDMLCTQQVRLTAAVQAQAAMQEQRERQRARRSREDMNSHDV